MMSFNDQNERSLDSPLSESKKELTLFSGIMMNIMIGSILSIPSNSPYLASYFRKFNGGEVYPEDFLFYFAIIYSMYMLGKYQISFRTKEIFLIIRNTF